MFQASCTLLARSVLALALSASVARAAPQVVTIPLFEGDLFESFETQDATPNTCINGGVFEGHGVLCAHNLGLTVIRNNGISSPSCTDYWSAEGSRFALHVFEDCEFIFNEPVVRFGGMFGEFDETFAFPLTFEFYDAADVLIDTVTRILDHQYCTYAWEGFESWGAPIKRIRLHYPASGMWRTTFDALTVGYDPSLLGTNYCLLTLNSTGAAAEISAGGLTSVAGNNLTLHANHLPASVAGLFFYGTTQLQIPFGSGTLCISPAAGVYRLPVSSSGPSGELRRVVDLENPPTAAAQITAGSTWNFQAWFRDPAGVGAPYNTSNGLEIMFRP